MSVSPSPRRPGALEYAGFATLGLVWGTQYLVIKVAQPVLPPLMALALRFLVVAAAAQLYLLVERAPTPPDMRWKRAVYGAMHAAGMGLLYWGQTSIPSSLVGVLLATTPLAVAVMAHAFIPGERLTKRTTLPLVVGVAGAMLITLGMDRDGDRATHLVGVGAIVSSVLCSAGVKVFSKKLVAQLPVSIMLRDLGVVVGLCSVLASALVEDWARARAEPWAMLSILYLGLVASAGATGWYLVLLRRVPVTVMATLQLLTAAVAFGAGVVFGGDHPSTMSVLGCVLVMSGLTWRTKEVRDE
ncbi:MAG: DMT family transporter [Myxococcota bacterium]